MSTSNVASNASTDPADHENGVVAFHAPPTDDTKANAVPDGSAVVCPGVTFNPDAPDARAIAVPNGRRETLARRIGTGTPISITPDADETSSTPHTCARFATRVHRASSTVAVTFS